MFWWLVLWTVISFSDVWNGVAVAANKFYHDVRIITEPDEAKKASYVALVDLTRRVMETCIDLLGFSAPDKM